MANKAGLLSKQKLRDAIKQEMKLASDLIAIEAAQFRPSINEWKPFTEKALKTGVGNRIALLLKLQLGRHVEHDHVPPELVCGVTYRLSFLAHSAGPVWTRIERDVAASDDRMRTTVFLGGWELLSEDGDLSSAKGVFWPELDQHLTRDLLNIVPDEFADEFLDGDLTASVAFDPAYWVSGNCSPAQQKIQAVA